MAGWPNLSELVSTAHANAPVGLVGAPLAAGSVTPGRCDLAPELLRKTLRRIGRYDVETRRELATEIFDHGDVPIEEMSIEGATPIIRHKVAASTATHTLTLLVGVITLGTGRTTVLQGIVHLVIFAAFLFFAVVP